MKIFPINEVSGNYMSSIPAGQFFLSKPNSKLKSHINIFLVKCEEMRLYDGRLDINKLKKSRNV